MFAYFKKFATAYVHPFLIVPTFSEVLVASHFR